MQKAGEARIVLDLAAQARHLHVDQAAVAGLLALRRQLLARDRLAGAARQLEQQLRFRFGEVYRLAGLEQAPPLELEHEGAELDRADAGLPLGPGAGALQDRA